MQIGQINKDSLHKQSKKSNFGLQKSVEVKWLNDFWFVDLLYMGLYAGIPAGLKSKM